VLKVDHFGKDELIYLGPDEQIIPSDIDWITQRAAERGYPIPAAFMSSKKVSSPIYLSSFVCSNAVVVVQLEFFYPHVYWHALLTKDDCELQIGCWVQPQRIRSDQ